MARSETCKNCCPNGGAIFSIDFGTYQHGETKQWMDEPAWVKVCNNCGHYKTPRKYRKPYSWDEITALQNDNALRNRRERAIFHMYAEQGHRCKLKRIRQAYRDEAQRRGITQIPIITIDYYNDYETKKISEAITRKGVSARQVNYCINLMAQNAITIAKLFNEHFGTKA